MGFVCYPLVMRCAVTHRGQFDMHLRQGLPGPLHLRVCEGKPDYLIAKRKKRKKLNPNLATSKQLCCCIFIYFYLRVVFLYFPWPLEQKESLQTVGIWTVHGKKLALGHVLDVPRN